MNKYMGNDGGDGMLWFPKMTVIGKPSYFFVTMDEDDVTINDAFFRLDANKNLKLDSPGAILTINDWPATYHGGAGGISFADGHAEKHQWKFLGRPPVGFKPSGGLAIINPSVIKDVAYLTRMATEPVGGWK